jgi:hypothetical protein
MSEPFHHLRHWAGPLTIRAPWQGIIWYPKDKAGGYDPALPGNPSGTLLFMETTGPARIVSHEDAMRASWWRPCAGHDDFSACWSQDKVRMWMSEYRLLDTWHVVTVEESGKIFWHSPKRGV